MTKLGRLNRTFARTGPDYRFGDQVDFNDIRDTFGFKTMVVGRWVTKQERYLAANLIYDALADLAQILNLPPMAIGLRNNLNFAFGHGGQKGVQAHYESHSRTLALAKNAGAGALAHEWFHAFDHHIAKYMFADQSSLHFASHSWLRKPIENLHPLNQILSQLYQHTFLASDGKQPSDYMKQCIAFDKQHKSYYMSMPEELAARSFEACIAIDTQIRNQFLVENLTHSGLIYPQKQHVIEASMIIKKYFNLLGSQLS